MSIINRNTITATVVSAILCTIVAFYKVPVSVYISDPAGRAKDKYIVNLSGTKYETALVTKVSDGDTFEIDGKYKVRLLGVDTPELHHPIKHEKCYGKAAGMVTEKLISGHTVYLVADKDPLDKYRRKLRYVYIPVDENDRANKKAVFLNAFLAGEGYARDYPFAPNTKYAKYFRNLAGAAEETDMGLWGYCNGTAFD